MFNKPKASHRILVCDDDQGILEVCKIILQEKGHKVKTLAESAQIFSIIDEFKPEMIFLDLWMPDLDGEQVTCKLKENSQTAEIPVVIISASREVKVSALRCGANDFIYKPFNVEDLEAVVSKYLA